MRNGQGSQGHGKGTGHEDDGTDGEETEQEEDRSLLKKNLRNTETESDNGPTQPE